MYRKLFPSSFIKLFDETFKSAHAKFEDSYEIAGRQIVWYEAFVKINKGNNITLPTHIFITFNIRKSDISYIAFITVIIHFNGESIFKIAEYLTL